LRRDSYRDNWNNEVGREVGRIAADNTWSDDQIAEYARIMVTGDSPVAIVDLVEDKRIPADVSQISTFDYLFFRPTRRETTDYIQRQGAPVGAIHNALPPGTYVPNPSMSGEFGDLRPPPDFIRDKGAVPHQFDAPQMAALDVDAGRALSAWPVPAPTAPAAGLDIPRNSVLLLLGGVPLPASLGRLRLWSSRFPLLARGRDSPSGRGRVRASACRCAQRQLEALMSQRDPSAHGRA